MARVYKFVYAYTRRRFRDGEFRCVYRLGTASGEAGRVGVIIELEFLRDPAGRRCRRRI